MALTPQEQAELDALELQDLEAQAAAYEATQKDAAGSQVDRNRIGAVPPPVAPEPMTPMEQAADTAKSMAIQGGFPAAGQMVGAATGVGAPLAVPLFGGIMGGAGYMVDSMRTGSEITPGGLTTSIAAGAIPGASTAKAALRPALAQGGINLGLTTAQTYMDEGRRPTGMEAALSFGTGFGSEYVGRGVGKLVKAGYPDAALNEAEILSSGRDGVLRQLRKEGFVVAPHTVERGSDIVSSIGGKAAMQQTAAKKNQVVWQRMANEDLGIIDATSRKGAALPIYDETLENVRSRAAAPYERIQEISKTAKERLASLRKDLQGFAGGDPIQEKVLSSDFQAVQDNLAVRAAADVEQLKLTRAKAHDAFKAWRAGDPAAYEAWKSNINAANALEDTIEKAGEQLGDKELVKQLRQSRKLIAKTYAIQEAINPASGMLDPAVIGRMRDARVPLDGKLKLIGDAQLVFNKEAVDAARVPAPGVDNMSTKFAISSAAHGSPAGTLAAIAQGTIGRLPRSYYMSDTVQNIIAAPRNQLRPVQNGIKLMSTFGTRAAGRNVNPFLWQDGEKPR